MRTPFTIRHRTASLAALTAATGVLLVGAGLLVAATFLNRGPARGVPAAPAVTPLGACEFAVMRTVPVPPPADMTFAAVATRDAAGGGYEITGLVDVRPNAGGTLRWPWTCDVEMRPSVGWHAWNVTLTAAMRPAAAVARPSPDPGGPNVVAIVVAGGLALAAAAVLLYRRRSLQDPRCNTACANVDNSTGTPLGTSASLSRSPGVRGQASRDTGRTRHLHGTASEGDHLRTRRRGTRDVGEDVPQPLRPPRAPGRVAYRWRRGTVARRPGHDPRAGGERDRGGPPGAPAGGPGTED